MLTRETMTGPWAGLPVAWTDDDHFDEQTFRGDIARCCAAGMPGIYTGGTTGEFYAMELDEFRAVSRAAVTEGHAGGKPVMIGVSSTYTIGACRRAAFAAEIGADAIQVTLPFWMEVADKEVVPFFREVSRAAGSLPLSVYETRRCKKALTLDQHRAVKDAVPNYIMVKANESTLGCTPQGCAQLSEFTNVFVGENQWASLGPLGACGGCSSVVYWNPRFILPLWKEVEKRNWPAVQAGCAKIQACFDFLETFAPKAYADSAFDRLGGVTGGFLKTSLRSRGPYPSATPADVQIMRQWYREHFPEMLDVV